MNINSGELSPRTQDGQASVERAVKSGQVGVQKQPSGVESVPLSGSEAIQETVTVSEAARYALEEETLPEAAPWNEAERELRNRILAKMLASMRGERVNLNDVQDLLARARSTDAQKTEPISSTPKHVEKEVFIAAQDGIASVRAVLAIPAEGIEEEGIRLAFEGENEEWRMPFPGDIAQVNFQSVHFRLEMEPADSELSEGIEADLVMRVWASERGEKQPSLLGMVHWNDGEFVLDAAALRGFSGASTELSPRQASTAYRSAEQPQSTPGETKIIL